MKKLMLIYLSSLALSAHAAPSSFSFSGTLTDSGGTPLTGPVNLVLAIYNPAADCLLYEETQTISTLGTDGSFSVNVGTGTRDGNDPSVAWNAVFANGPQIRAPGTNCSSGYTPSQTDIRRLRVTANSDILSPDFTITSVPMASVAETLNGKGIGDLIQVRNDGSYILTQTSIEDVFSTANYATLMNLLSGTGPYMQNNPGAPVSFNNQQIINVGTPISANDAANKNYVDTAVAATSGKIANQDYDFSSIGVGFGGGMVIAWDASANQWVAQLPEDPSKLPLTGGTLAGPVNFNAPTTFNNSATFVSTNNFPVTSPTAPAINFGGNTGLYSQSGALGLSVSGTARLTVASGGNVGIGTMNPNSLLDVNAGSTPLIGKFSAAVPPGQSATLAIANTHSFNNAASLTFMAGPSPTPTWEIGTDFNMSGTPDFYLYNQSYGAQPALYIDTANHIGIGTMSPQASLDVVGHIKSSGPAPAISSCGTSASIVGTDTKGSVTIGSGSVSSCQISFMNPYTPTPPVCVITWNETIPPAITFGVGATTTDLTVYFSGDANGKKFNYICLQ